MTSKKIFHYLYIHFENSSTYTFGVHEGITDLLNDSTHPNIDKLAKYLNSIAEKCNIFGVKNFYISALVYATRIVLPILERANETIQNMCNSIGVIYINNQNILQVHLLIIHPVNLKTILKVQILIKISHKCFFLS